MTFSEEWKTGKDLLPQSVASAAEWDTWLNDARGVVKEMMPEHGDSKQAVRAVARTVQSNADTSEDVKAMLRSFLAAEYKDEEEGAEPDWWATLDGHARSVLGLEDMILFSLPEQMMTLRPGGDPEAHVAKVDELRAAASFIPTPGSFAMGMLLAIMLRGFSPAAAAQIRAETTKEHDWEAIMGRARRVARAMGAEARPARAAAAQGQAGSGNAPRKRTGQGSGSGPWLPKVTGVEPSLVKQRLDKGVCLKCAQPGHMFRDCPRAGNGGGPA